MWPSTKWGPTRPYYLNYDLLMHTRPSYLATFSFISHRIQFHTTYQVFFGLLLIYILKYLPSLQCWLHKGRKFFSIVSQAPETALGIAVLENICFRNGSHNNFCVGLASFKLSKILQLTVEIGIRIKTYYSYFALSNLYIYYFMYLC